MHIKVTIRDLGWSYAAQIFQFGAGIFILPVVLKMLPSSELAMWYVFLTIGSMIGLLDFGFQPSISRNASYIFSGARTLLSKGISHDGRQDSVDNELLFSFITTCRKIYRIISAVSLAVMGCASWYVYDVAKTTASPTTIYLAWAIFLLSTAINFYYSYYASLLIGRGYIKKSKKIIVFSKSAYILIAYAGLIAGGGLIAVSIATLGACIVTRILSYRYFYSDGLIRRKTLKSDPAKTKETFKAIWGSSSRLGIVAIGAFLSVKFSYLLCAKFLGLQTAAEYGLTQQLMDFLISGCTIVFSTYSPMISQDRIIRNSEGIKNKFSVSICIAFITFIAGVIAIIVIGYPLLSAIKSKTSIIPLNFFIIYAIMMFLELNHSLCASFIATKNEIPFVKPSLISGAAIILLSSFLLSCTSLGLMSLILSQMAVQLCFNNWRWPYLVMKELEMNYISIFERGYAVIKREVQMKVYR
jgi:O-antigen/teichoic acid export membrane protein